MNEDSYFECDTCCSSWSLDPTDPRAMRILDSHEANNPGHRVKEAR